MPQACNAGVAWACGVERVYRVEHNGTPGAGLVIEYAADLNGSDRSGAPDVAGDAAGLAAAILPELPTDVESVLVTREHVGMADRDGQ